MHQEKRSRLTLRQAARLIGQPHTTVHLRVRQGLYGPGLDTAGGIPIEALERVHGRFTHDQVATACRAYSYTLAEMKQMIEDHEKPIRSE